MEVIRKRVLFRSAFGGKEASLLLDVIDFILWAHSKLTWGRVTFYCVRAGYSCLMRVIIVNGGGTKGLLSRLTLGKGGKNTFRCNRRYIVGSELLRAAQHASHYSE